ncbi:alpha/beta hydrolase [Streptomyces sp. NPDC023838]|uniref:esterase/lipase family protein n=1 Tax=Streptomyces sp. NPDC023838 TaxID=3154325 RepID=UPI0033F146C5
MDRLPIVYVRGYAGSTAGIDDAADDPFYGFNLGSTHVRIDGDGDPLFHQFEGPLLRLIHDEGYKLFAEGDQHRYLLENEEVDPKSLWVYRFYDQAATTFMPPHKSGIRRAAAKLYQKVTAEGFDIESAAEGLYKLITLVREKTGAEKVHVVAHSMGGLVVRCMMQKICLLSVDEGVSRRQRRRLTKLLLRPWAKRGARIPMLGTPREPASKLVARFFTYGTPHGGIASRVWGVDWFQKTFGPAGSYIFDPQKMYGYLNPHAGFGDVPPRSADWDPQAIPEEVFSADDIFCLIGTNSKDYQAWHGLSRLSAGPSSDGLVLIDRAYVHGAHRAYVHRSHSGRYGLVNSEEGYQNLRRFLFGQWGVGVSLVGLPPAPDGSPWQADMRLAIRGLPIVMSERRTEHWCPILLSEEIRSQRAPLRSVPLVSTFLLEPGQTAKAEPPHQGRMRYTMALQVFKVQERDDFFRPNDHLEQVPEWADWLIIDMRPATDGCRLQAWAAWKSTVAGENDRFDPITELPRSFGLSGDSFIDLPIGAQALPVLGEDARLRISVHDRRRVRVAPPRKRGGTEYPINSRLGRLISDLRRLLLWRRRRL